MDELFERDKANATELTREDWSARSWPDKVGERILAPLRVFM